MRRKLTDPPRAGNVAAQFALFLIVAFPEMPSNLLRGIVNKVRSMAFLLGVLVALLLSTVPARAVEDIPPPFGFHWNDSMTKVEQVLVGPKPRLLPRKKGKRLCLDRRGLVQPGSQATLFTFKGRFSSSSGIAVQYPELSSSVSNDRMGEIRRYFARSRHRETVFAHPRYRLRVIQTARGLSWIIAERCSNSSILRATRPDGLPQHHRHLQGDLREGACPEGRSRSSSALRPATLSFLLQPLQPARQTGFRDRAHPVDEQDAVQMIDLMLQSARE